MCFKQIIHLHDVHLHDDVNAKETFNYVLQKNIGNLTNYAQELKDFFESQRSFLTPPSWQPQIIPIWMVGFSWNWWMHIYARCLPHFGMSVSFVIMQTKLKFCSYSIAKCDTNSHWIELKIWCTFTIIINSYKNDLVLTPLHAMRRICCLMTLCSMSMKVHTKETH
jgi:hypothetical protein